MPYGSASRTDTAVSSPGSTQSCERRAGIESQSSDQQCIPQANIFH